VTHRRLLLSLALAGAPAAHADPPPAPVAPADQLGAPSRLRATAIGLGVGELALAGAAFGLYGSAASDCGNRACGPGDASGARARADASYALFAVAGAVLVAEVVVIVLRANEIHRRRLAAGLARAGFGWSFGGL
jgi:hypothetical protein